MSQEAFSKKKDRTDVGGWVVGRPPQEKKEPTPFFLENIKKGVEPVSSGRADSVTAPTTIGRMSQ